MIMRAFKLVDLVRLQGISATQRSVLTRNWGLDELRTVIG